MPITQATAARKRRGGAIVAYLMTDRGEAYSLGFTPEGATISGDARVFTQIPRQGQLPVIRADSPQLGVVTWSHVVVDSAGQGGRYADGTVADLRLVAQRGQRVRLMNVSKRHEMGRWFYVTDLQVSITRRWPDQQIREATLSWTFTQAVDVTNRIGRTPPPPAKAKPRATSSTKTKPTAATYRTHKVAAGETLWKIAGSMLGNYNRWPEIAKLNKAILPNPNRLKIGMTLKVPAK